MSNYVKALDGILAACVELRKQDVPVGAVAVALAENLAQCVHLNGKDLKYAQKLVADMWTDREKQDQERVQ